MLRIPFLSIRLLTYLLLTLLSNGQVNADSGGEAAVKTAFLYNFFKFVEWPKGEANQQAFSLCTTGNDLLGDSLLVLEHKTIDGKAMLVRRGVEGQELKTCHMVYLSHSENALAIVNDLKGLPIVTVSDQPNFIRQGGMIGLVEDGNRLSFEIDLNAANAVGVHISAKLLKLAKDVNIAD